MVISIVKKAVIFHRLIILNYRCFKKSSFSSFSGTACRHLNYVDVLFKDIGHFGNRPALTDWSTGKTFNYSQLHHHVLTGTTNLIRQGFGKGQVMTICSDNASDSIITMLSALWTGGTVHLMSHLSTQSEIERQLLQTHSRFIVSSGYCLETVLNASDSLPDIERVFVVDGEVSKMPENDICSSTKQLIYDCGNEYLKPPAVDADDVCFLMPSSGTTGFPKLTQISHRNMSSNVVSADDFCKLNESETNLLVIPFTHMYGLQCVVGATLLSGGKLLLQSRFKIEEVLEAVEKHRVTHLPLVPTMIVQLLNSDKIENFDLSSLRDILCSASRLSASIEESFTTRLKSRAPNVDLRQLYGMTELSGATLCVPYPSNRSRSAVGSVGVKSENIEVKLMREIASDGESSQSESPQFEEVGPNEKGEIWFRSQSCCLGYLNNEEASSSLYHEDWLRSGDIAYKDDDGYFYIIDRIKELIKYKGNQVAPVEVEAVLLSHPDVADCAVVGMPHEIAGQVPTAFIVRQRDVEPAVLVKLVEKTLSPSKQIRGGVVFVDSIPKTASGKLLRRLLADGLRNKSYKQLAASIKFEN